MKTTTTEPTAARYIGSEHPDGTMAETVADAIDEATAPLCYRDPEGTRHYFDTATN